MARNGIITALDIGSSKIACMIAYRDLSGKLKVAGIGHQISHGIRAGIVVDVKKAESSILAAINAAEKMAGQTIDRAIINISGNSLNSRIINVEAKISGHEVTDTDIRHIIERAREQCATEESQIVHCMPVAYAIDDSTGIRDPRGMCGDNLSTEIHVVSASATAARNLANCLARCHLDVEDYVISSYMSGLACLTEDEKNLGVILLDIGGGNTSIAMFAEGMLIYAGSVALGGEHVTRDIARGLSITIPYAERVKTLYGAVVSTPNDEYEVIDIPIADMQADSQPEYEGGGYTRGGDSYISKTLLTAIIKPRMEEILEMARRNIEARGLYQHTGPRVVLTGGGSQLPGLRELAGHIFSKHVRVGRPEPIEGMADSVQGPAFSACVGMLKHATSERTSATVHKLPPREGADRRSGSGGNRMVKWFKENF